MKIINLSAGPNASKSTTAYGLAYRLKQKGLNVELVTEFAKDLVWGRRFDTLKNQPYVFGKQLDRIFKLEGQVDWIVTDSPIFLSSIYGNNEHECFNSVVLNHFNKYNNINFFIRRHPDKPYNTTGRVQTFDEAKELDTIILNYMVKNSIPFMVVDEDIHNQDKTVNTILDAVFYLEKGKEDNSL